LSLHPPNILFNTAKALLFLLLIPLAAYSQKNLVPNGSFEISKNRGPYLSAAAPWKGIGTIDYYRKPYAGDSSRFKGAHTGYCYAGMRYQADYKEFMYVKLNEPLKKGQSYEFEMYLRVAPWSTVTLKEIGVHFSKGGYKLSDDLTEQNGRDTIDRTGIAHEEGDWFRFHGTYVAQGGEKVMTIGNFGEKIKKQLVKPHFFYFGFKEAYYFVDDVALFKEGDRDTVIVKKDTTPVAVDPPDSSVVLQVGEVVQLDNILFETGKSHLLPGSFIELNRLADLLGDNPTMEIRINGHTDNKGNAEKNMALSEARAKAVYDYLVSKGIKNRMEFKGYGSTKPLTTNDTEEGRRQNRRVEFEVLKQ
jgi:OOP family OmpA-OmpF porin